MTVLLTAMLCVLTLPLASDLIASLLGLRDGGQTPWRLVRVLIDALMLLSLILWLEDLATYAIGAALMTIVFMEFIGYFAWRWLFIGIRKS